MDNLEDRDIDNFVASLSDTQVTKMLDLAEALHNDSAQSFMRSNIVDELEDSDVYTEEELTALSNLMGLSADMDNLPKKDKNGFYTFG